MKGAWRRFFQGCLLTLGLISLVAEADWEQQWRYVLEKAVSEMEEGAERARVLMEDSKSLEVESSQHKNQSSKGDNYRAATHYQQATLAFRRSLDGYQRASRDFSDVLEQVQPSRHTRLPSSVKSGMRQQLRRIHALAQSTAKEAADDFNVGVREFNAGAKLYRGSTHRGENVLNEHARSQAQFQDFQVKRMAGLTKLAMIKVRDRAAQFKDPSCAPRLQEQYQSVMNLLGSAQLAYRDAAAYPDGAQLKLNQGRSMVVQAKEISAEIQDQYEFCLR